MAKQMKIIIYSLLSLFVMDFLNISGYIFLILFFLILLADFVLKKDIKLNSKLVTLFLFGFSHFLLYASYFSFSFRIIIYFLIGPVGGFFIGKFLIEVSRDYSENKSVLIYTLIIIISLFVHGGLNMYLKVSTGVTGTSDYMIDFWSNNVILRTYEGLLLLPISVTFFSSLFIKDQNIKRSLRLFLLVSSLLCLWATIILANRTLIVVFIIILLFSTFLYILKKPRNKLRLFIKIVIFSAVILTAYYYNIFGLQTLISESPLVKRLSSTNSGLLDTERYLRYYNFFKNFIKYPFGGRRIPIYLGEPAYVHNVWLDIYLDVGIIPFLLFTLYTILIFKDFLKFFKKCTSEFLKYFLLALYLSFFLAFTVEPVLSVDPYYIIIFLIMNGMISGYLTKIRKNELLSGFK